MDAYHGTQPQMAQEIVARQHVKPSHNAYDWLGHGAYFWEEAPRRAAEWARRDGSTPTDAAVVAARVRLGRCLNLVDTRYADLVREAARLYQEVEQSEERTPITNRGGRGDLNCAVFNFLCEHVDVQIDTLRAVFPEGEALFDGATLLAQSHIQLCVRNPACILSLELFSPARQTA